MESNLASLPPGNIFGEETALSKKPVGYSILAMNNHTEVVFISNEDFTSSDFPNAIRQGIEAELNMRKEFEDVRYK